MELFARDVLATARLAEALASVLEISDVLVLEGGLGAGKTTFVGMVAHALGLPMDEPVTSPTFAIVHELEARIPLVHADLYRLGSDAEVHELGLSDLLGRDTIAFIEWGDAFTAALGRVDVRLTIHVRDDDARTFDFAPRSERGEKLCLALSDAFREEPDL